MDLLFDVFLVVYGLTLVFVGITFTIHLDTKSITREELVVMVILALLPILNTIMFLIAIIEVFKEFSKEIDEINRNNRDKM